MTRLPRYDPQQTYHWNYVHAPEPVEIEVPEVPGDWQFCGKPVASPLGIPAGPLLNGRWCLYYASLGFDVLTYKTVRTREHPCYPLPNLQPVDCATLPTSGNSVPVAPTMNGSWAVSFGMPSQAPEIWRADVETTRKRLAPGKLLVVSVVGTVQPGWTINDLAADYALAAKWAAESGADLVEVNFSCPNVATSDSQLYQHAVHARHVAACVREAIGPVPLILKIGHIPSPHSAACLVESVTGIADALAMVNCIVARVMDQEQQLLFEGQPRGIGGAAIRDATLAQIRAFRDAIDRIDASCELVGVGGVFTAQHAAQFLSQGAAIVQVATAAMVDPLVGIQLKREMAAPD